jgi:ATP-grasp domain
MKVLLLDTAFSSAPIYDYLLAAGHDVWVMGNRAQDLLAMRAGNKWIEEDYSQVDAVREHVRYRGIDYVVPGCTDRSMETCVQVNIGSHLLDPFDVNRALSNKEAFRDLCRKLDLPAPLVLRKKDFPRNGQFICKPVDAFSGRGITVFQGDDLQSLHQAYDSARKASPTSAALIETFAEGDLYSCSAFIQDHQISQAFYVREGSSINPFAVDTSYVVYDLPANCTRAVEKSLERISSALQLRNGLMHAQFIFDGQRISIVEVSRRCPGDLYSLLIEYSTGYRHAAKYASYFIKAEEHSDRAQRRHILRHTVGSINDAILGGISFNTPLISRGFFPLQPVGQVVRGRQGSRVGILFCEFVSHEQLREAYALFLSRAAYDLN